MIELKNVSKIYTQSGNASIGIHNISLSFNKGEIVAITGASGSGKSTLLNVICGVDTYEEGEIYYNKEETSFFDTNDMDIFRRKYVSFIYQNYNIIDSYTVLENVMVPLLIDGKSEKEARKRALELIDKVGLAKRANHKGSKLSGGEKQRCVIARALANDAPILACDEPTGNLDSKTGSEIIKLLKEVATDKLLLIVTHNYDQVKDIVTRCITLKDGEVINDTNNVENIILDDDLDLDNTEITKKVLFNLSLKNIKNTPKKTIFLLLVMMVFSFIVLFLYSSSYTAAKEAEYNSLSSYRNTLVDKGIIYSKDGREIKDLNLDGVEYYNNAFYEEEYGRIKIGGETVQAVISNHLPKSYTKMRGNLPSSNREAFIIFTSDYYNNYDSALGSEIYFEGQSFTVVGYAQFNSKEKMAYSYIYTKADLRAMNNYTLQNNSRLIIDGVKKHMAYDSSLPKDTIKIRTAKTIDKNTLRLILADKYEYDLSKANIVIEQSDFESISFNLTDFIESQIFEISFYGNTDSVSKKASSLGYSTLFPAKAGIITISFSYIIFVVLTGLSTLAIIASLFVSYVILSRIYQSRRKDYSILRSLGLVKKHMSHVVNMEVFVLMITSSILSLIIFIVLGLTIPFFNTRLQAFNLFFIIIYFILMLLFGLYISKRFNRKLFEFSVSKSIREVA